MSANPITRHLDITYCKDSHQAVADGFTYQEGYQPIEVVQAVVVGNGTVEGNSTVDFILKDAQGQKYVFMITSKLLKMLAQTGEHT